MPAEWDQHAATLISWPTTQRAAIWDGDFEQAMADYAEVAAAIIQFETVVLLVHPEQMGQARRRCPSSIEILEMEIDDSWIRDNGPIFVKDHVGRVAAIGFQFNAWGEKYSPWGADAEVPKRLASHFGVPLYQAPMVLEGGAFFVDGEGTLLTTEQCLLHPNRNPGLDRSQIQAILSDYLGVDRVVWLDRGHHLDRDTDGHIDGILQYLGPGRVILHRPLRPDPSAQPMTDNRRRLENATDTAGRTFEVVDFHPGTTTIAPLNFYLCNGGVIVPTEGGPADREVLEQIGAALPDRSVVPVPGRTLLQGGGGPHCITQQIPVGI